MSSRLQYLSEMRRGAYAGHAHTPLDVPFRAFMLIESAGFIGAALLHRQVFTHSPIHSGSLSGFVAEMLVGVWFLVGTLATWLAPRRARRIALGTQTTALYGTVLTLLIMAFGVVQGPHMADLVFNATILLLLNLGLVVVSAVPSPDA